MKLNEKNQAIRLRKIGESYSAIRTRVKVSKSTLSLWLRDIKLTPEQKEKIHVTLRQKNAYKGAKVQQKKRIKITKRILAEAKKEFKLFFQSPLFLAGLMLYWAEGDKSDVREAVKFSNSDPHIIKLMMQWFRAICKVPNKKFRVTLHIHELHCRKDIKQYWSKLLHLPLTQFYKTQVKPTSLRHRRNRLYNGTCAVIVNNKNLYRRIRGWKLGFIENMKNIKSDVPVAQWIERETSNL